MGRVEDAIGVKWISDRVFNHDPGKKAAKHVSLIYKPLTLALHCCPAVHAKHNSILLAKLDSLRVMKTKVAVIGLNC